LPCNAGLSSGDDNRWKTSWRPAAVVELPIQCAHVRGMFRRQCSTHISCHALQNLTQPERVFEFIGQPEPVEQIGHDGGVADAAALVVFHHIACDIAVLRRRIAVNGLGSGKD